MDALTFQTPILLRGFNTKKEPIYEISYEDMLKELELTYPQFVDLCILVYIGFIYVSVVVIIQRK
jgi:flap endonuclease-1